MPNSGSSLVLHHCFMAEEKEKKKKIQGLTTDFQNRYVLEIRVVKVKAFICILQLFCVTRIWRRTEDYVFCSKSVVLKMIPTRQHQHHLIRNTDSQEPTQLYFRFLWLL